MLSFLNKDEIQTNVKGTRAHFATRVQHNVDWFTTYFLFEPVSGLSADKAGVLRTGLTLTFKPSCFQYMSRLRPALFLYKK